MFNKHAKSQSTLTQTPKSEVQESYFAEKQTNKLLMERALSQVIPKLPEFSLPIFPGLFACMVKALNEPCTHLILGESAVDYIVSHPAFKTMLKLEMNSHKVDAGSIGVLWNVDVISDKKFTVDRELLLPKNIFIVVSDNNAIGCSVL